MELKNDIEERRGPLRNMRRKTSFRFPILVKVGLKEATETKFRANRKMGRGFPPHVSQGTWDRKKSKIKKTYDLI